MTIYFFLGSKASSRRPPHKHHRRNISTFSAREVLSNLAPGDHDEELEIAGAGGAGEDDVEEQDFLVWENFPFKMDIRSRPYNFISKAFVNVCVGIICLVFSMVNDIS